FVIGCSATLQTLRGLGPFGAINSNTSLLFLQTFICVLAVVALILAASVAERKVAESGLRKETERLQQSEGRFRQLAENIQEVFYISDQTIPRVTYVSPAYEEIWGRSRQSLYDNPRSFLEAVHPEDRPRVLQAIERLSPQNPLQLEYRILRPDGAIRYIRDRAFPVFDA